MKPKRLVNYRGKLYSFRQLEDITGKTTNAIIGWERRGYLEFMLDQYFRKRKAV